MQLPAQSSLFYLDSNAVIFGIEAGSAWSGLMSAFLRAVETGRFVAATSALTLGEVLVKPLQMGARAHVEAYEALLKPDGDIRLLPVDRSVIRAAAEFRAGTGMKLADAIHVATALQGGATNMVTGDERLARALPAPIRWTRFDDLARILYPQ